ncbi:calcium-binding protein [Aporhodopirellula aestuarii]|uniref:calcium-binding protein n=1 Tax=Aporhodopirellula aestuarii TaxID=2950107 RepID=UPI002AFFDC25|nr:calcium-binding protein [Aporhodopirellula aestuarii]
MKIQSLERRAMLTAVLFDNTTGELEIDGTNDPDYVVVATENGQTVVTEYDAFDNPIQSHSFDQVTSIEVDLKDGDDVFANRTSIPVIASGGDGDDVIIGGSGNDVIESGSSSTVTTFADPAIADATLIAMNDLNQISTIATMDLPGDILFGGGGDDQLVGDDGTQVMFGGDGRDQLLGGADADYLLGQGDADEVIGGTGNDILVGGNGPDALAGNQGNDALYGDDAEENEIVDNLMASTSGSFLHGANGYGDDNGEYAIHVLDNDFLDEVAGIDEEDLEWLREEFPEYTEQSIQDYVAVHGFEDAAFIDNMPSFFAQAVGIRIEDVLQGGSGDDHLDGGSGNDYLTGDQGADVLIAGDGIDYLFGGDNPEMVSNVDLPTSPYALLQFAGSQEGADVLVAADDGDRDYLAGGSGQDVIMAGDWKDLVDGGAGDDILGPFALNHSSVSLFGNTGNDLLIGSHLDDDLSGGLGADTYYSGEGSDHLDGMPAFSESEGRFLIEQDVWMDGTAMSDETDNADWVHAIVHTEYENGVLTIHGSAIGDAVFVTPDDFGNVVLRQSIYSGFTSPVGVISDQTWSGVFHEVTFANVNEIIFDGGAGADWFLNQTNIPSQLFGGNGRDFLIGGDAADHIEGGDGDDLIYGRGSTDVLFGDDGDDEIHGGENPFVYDPSAPLELDEMLTLMERIEGGSGNDRLYGGSGSDLIAGCEGRDHLFGDADADVIFVDSLIPSGTSSVNDGVTYQNEAHGGAGDDWIYGGSLSDHLYGDAGDDILEGRGGDDFLDGGSGSDELHGDEGNDHLDSGLADGPQTVNDLLQGGEGHDELYARHGAVELHGGEGDDWMYLNASASATGGSGLDYASGLGELQDESELDEAVNQLYQDGENPYQLWRENRDNPFGGPGDVLISMTTTLEGNHDTHADESETDAAAVDQESKVRAAVVDGVLNVRLNDGGQSVGFTQDAKAIYLLQMDAKGNLLDKQTFSKVQSIHVIGGAGNDVIRNETTLASVIEGGDGDDELFGGTNCDKIIGGAGNDFLDGGKDSSRDDLRGGSGRDTFVVWQQEDESSKRDEHDDFFSREDLIMEMFQTRK